MASRNLIVAAVQICSGRDVAGNLEQACHWVRLAAAQGADLVALPECFGFLGPEAEVHQHAQFVEGGRFTEPLRALARELRIAVLAGSVPEHGPDARHIYNTSVLIGRDGTTLATYRKIHLFDIDVPGTRLIESSNTARGGATVLLPFEGWQLGLSICYDLRFPELYRQLSQQGAQVLFVPAAFTLHTGKDHWEALLRARAIENQCYVVAAAQFGRHDDKRVSWGKSMIVDPWGSVVAQASERPGSVAAQLDAAYQQQVRSQLPCLRHRVI